MKTAKILLAIILLVLSYQTVNARIIHVPVDRPTIQAGIDSASIGDTVLVDRGTYYENIDFLGKNILVASNFISDRLQATVDSTIINGGGLGRVVKMQSVNGVNAGITGFTITNGRADNGGGGIYCYLTSARISHNVITGDTAGSGYGGGIYVGDCSPTIDSNQILNNLATIGGGVKYSDSSFGEIYGNIIRNNRAWSDNGGGNGGGLHISGGSSPSIRNNTIDSNTARYYGGGIECGTASPSIIGNTISANSSGLGGGISYSGGSSPLVDSNYIVGNHSGCGGGIFAGGSRSIVKRNIIAENLATEGGGGITCWTDTSIIVNNTFDNNSGADGARAGGICCWSNAVPEIKQNIIVNSTVGYGIGCSPGSNPVISYNDVWDNYSGNFYGCPEGVGDTSWGENCNQTPCDSFFNIIEYPLFDPDSTNYFLLCNSPCIDAGDSTDPVPSGGGRYIDMGWSEFPYIVGDANGDSVVTGSDVIYLINYLYRGGPPPCPYGAGDVNCDCTIDGADVVYLLNYLYRGGDPPCGSKEITFSNATSTFSKLPVLGEVQLSMSKLSKDGVAEINVTCDCDVDLALIQVELTYDPKEITLSEPALTSRTKGLQTYYSDTNGELKLGILDIKGVHHIPAGKGSVVSFKAEGKDFSSLTISEAILVDLDANTFLASTVENLVKSTSLPDRYSLHQNYPNPFNPETQISYTLPKDSHVKLTIYNVKGQKVKVLVDKFEAAGHKTVRWDGTNESGAEVASGIYVYRLEAGDFSDTKKMVLIR